MWEPFLWLALLVTAWRWLTRRRSPAPSGPLPDIGDAPPQAQPIVRLRLDDNGLATYSMVPAVPADAEPAMDPIAEGRP